MGSPTVREGFGQRRSDEEIERSREKGIALCPPERES